MAPVVVHECFCSVLDVGVRIQAVFSPLGISA